MVSRSGTLTYEIVCELSSAGLGQSTCVGIGGDPILGSTFTDILPLFEADPETEAVVLVGEIGGSDEERAAEYIRTMSKPVVGFVGGRTAPPGKRMGHAGAIVSGRTGTAQGKVEALTGAGVPVADTPLGIPALLKAVL
jgi:succinyl-CoA synthetase alpha subunit